MRLTKMFMVLGLVLAGSGVAHNRPRRPGATVVARSPRRAGSATAPAPPTPAPATSGSAGRYVWSYGAYRWVPGHWQRRALPVQLDRDRRWSRDRDRDDRRVRRDRDDRRWNRGRDDRRVSRDRNRDRRDGRSRSGRDSDARAVTAAIDDSYIAATCRCARRGSRLTVALARRQRKVAGRELLRPHRRPAGAGPGCLQWQLQVGSGPQRRDLVDRGRRPDGVACPRRGGDRRGAAAVRHAGRAHDLPGQHPRPRHRDLGIAVGDLTQVKGLPAVVVQGGVQSSKMMSILKKIDDTFTTSIDVKNGHPILFRGHELGGLDDPVIEDTDVDMTTAPEGESRSTSSGPTPARRSRSRSTPTISSSTSRPSSWSCAAGTRRSGRP